MEDIVGDVVSTLRMMIENGVEGTATATNGQYTVNFTLIDKTKPKYYRDPKWLADAYLMQGRTMQDIATEFDISPAAVNQWLVKHDIPTRPRGQKRDL
jgi:hypothetical protein